MSQLSNSGRSRAQRLVPVGTLAAGAFLLCAALWQAIDWGYNRVYVPEGKSLLLRYKGFPLLSSKPPAQPGHFARVDESGTPLEIGFLERMRGPGRHFYCPLWWERELVDDMVIDGGHVGIATCKMGDDLPRGEFLVDGTLGATMQKGIFRNVLAPGRYRINPYAYSVEVIGEQVLKSGCAGETRRLGQHPHRLRRRRHQPGAQSDPRHAARHSEQSAAARHLPGQPEGRAARHHRRGVQRHQRQLELQTRERRHTTLDESGEPIIADDDSGIKFPSNDGFDIHMDFTAVWGITPEQAPDVLRKFGTTDAVETKVVIPQIESICRNQGSRLGAVELLVGDSRMKFQEDTTAAFEKVMEEKDLTLLARLGAAHLHSARRAAADPGTLHCRRDQADQRAKANHPQRPRRRCRRRPPGSSTSRSGSRRRPKSSRRKRSPRAAAPPRRRGPKPCRSRRPSTAARPKSRRKRPFSRARRKRRRKSCSNRPAPEAAAGRLGLRCAESYNQWVFATGLPEDLRLHLLYAGDGTFWTDLKGFSDTLLGRQQQLQTHATSTPAP